MYISGHKYILRKVLKLVDVTYKSNLKQGIFYIDLPCGKYKVVNENHVIMNKKRVCKIHHLYKIMSEKSYFKEIFQSHRGMLAYLHSMTYDPHLTVQQIRDKIITQIMAFAYLASSTYNNENGDAFWIGCILHVVMDSYSQSHTIRLEHKQMKRPSYGTSSDKEQVFIEDSIFPYIKATTSKDLIAKLIRKKPSMKTYLLKKKKYVFRSYKRYIFYNQLKTIIAKRFKFEAIKHTDRKPYDISNFQYYSSQSVLYHAKYDLISKLKKYPIMYDRLIQDCVTILKLYNKYLSTKKRSVFIHALYNYIMNNTFRICQDDLLERTGTIYTS